MLCQAEMPPFHLYLDLQHRERTQVTHTSTNYISGANHISASANDPVHILFSNYLQNTHNNSFNNTSVQKSILLTTLLELPFFFFCWTGIKKSVIEAFFLVRCCVFHADTDGKSSYFRRGLHGLRSQPNTPAAYGPTNAIRMLFRFTKVP